MMNELTFRARNVEVGDHLVTITLSGTFYGPRIDSVTASTTGGVDYVTVTTVNGGRRTYNPYETVVVVRNVDYLVKGSRVYGGRVPTGGLSRTLRESYVVRYSSPFAAYLDSADDSPAVWGDTDGPGVVAWHGGRHVTHTSSTGYVEHHHLPERAVNGVHAYNMIRDLFPDVAAWDDAEDAENEDALYGHDWTGGPDVVEDAEVVEDDVDDLPDRSTVWADGFGRWHASVPLTGDDRAEAAHAHRLIMAALVERSNGVDLPVFSVVRELVTGHGTAHYVEDDAMPPADWQDYQGRLNADDL